MAGASTKVLASAAAALTSPKATPVRAIPSRGSSSMGKASEPSSAPT
jgi:hypothetical protein